MCGPATPTTIVPTTPTLATATTISNATIAPLLIVLVSPFVRWGLWVIAGRVNSRSGCELEGNRS